MIKKTDVEALLALEMNVMPIQSDKKACRAWQKYQTVQIPNLQVFNYESEHYALICGYNDIECIDIDLKFIKDFDTRKRFKSDLFDPCRLI